MLRKLIAAFALVLASVCAVATAHADDAAIRKGVEALFGPDVKVEGIAPAGFLGLFEVRIGTEHGVRIAYTDANGTYLMVGSAYDTETRTDLTDVRMRKLTAIRFADLPLAQSFKVVRGKGTRQLAYFSDPRCPYCRKLDQEIAKLEDVTVHVFLIPIIAPDSAAISKAVWCSPDRGKAWVDLMVNGVSPQAPKANCEAPIEKNLALSRKYRITGTPTLVFADGQRVSGWMTAPELAKLLDETSRK